MPKVNSLSQYIEQVEKIQKRWSKVDGEFIYPWFRGHSSKTYKLVPSILRNKNLKDNEDSYRHDFEQKGFPYLQEISFGSPVSEWEWYFLMQHYGLPTRLLDWTESSLTALYFALFYKDQKDYTNPCVWIMNPFSFNKSFHNTEQIFVYTDDEVKQYLPKIWSSRKIPEHPIAFQPIFKSRRIAAQKGCFTIHGANTNSFEKILKDRSILHKIEIEYYYIELIKADLQISGITESSLFPELSGLAREIKEYY